MNTQDTAEAPSATIFSFSRGGMGPEDILRDALSLCAKMRAEGAEPLITITVARRGETPLVGLSSQTTPEACLALQLFQRRVNDIISDEEDFFA